jgi:hypothetical protein
MASPMRWTSRASTTAVGEWSKISSHPSLDLINRFFEASDKRDLDRDDLDHRWCVLWTLENGKTVAVRHLAADQYAVDRFF